MKYYQSDNYTMLQLTKELRDELKDEYKNNDLVRTGKFYSDHKIFSNFYCPAVQEAYVSNVGRFDARKAHSFLYDVKDYMKHYLRQIRI